MKLRVALFLAAAFLAAALALTLLPACSDEVGNIDCLIECEGCYVESKGADSLADNCICVDLVDDDSDSETPPVCPL